MILVVDDMRLYGDSFQGKPIAYAITSAEAIEFLEKHFNELTEIWWDHDLGKLSDGSLDTVVPVINWVEERAINGEANHIETIRIHTTNPGGLQKLYPLAKYFHLGIAIEHTGLREIEGAE